MPEPKRGLSADVAPEPSTVNTNLVLVVVLLGIMLAAVDTTIVVLALPVMRSSLHTGMASLIWVIMAYLLTVTVLSTQVGRLGDLYGRVRMYNLGFLVFTIGSLLCGLSQSATQLIAFRVVQGIGGALIASNSGAIIADAVPAASRGRAYGITSIGWNVGAVLGILLGGVIITFLGWRDIFFINVPLGAVALWIGVRTLRDRHRSGSQRLDIPGVLLLGAGLFLVLLALTESSSSGWVTGDLMELAGGVLCLACFVVWERWVPEPVLQLGILRQRVLAASVSASFFQGLGGFAVLFLVIMYLQGVRGLSPFDASLLLVPGYVLGGVIAPFAGRLSDRLGARTPASIGLGLQIVAFGIYSTLGTATPLAVVVVAALANGIGSGFFFPANNSAVMANAPQHQYGVASGLLRTFANVGMVASFAVALLAATLAIPRAYVFAIFLGVGQLKGPLAAAFVTGMHHALELAAVLIAVALVLSLLRGKEARGRS